MSFVPCVEDDPCRSRHPSDAATVLAAARRIAFLEDRMSAAYELLSARRALATAPSIRREWREAAVALLAHLPEYGAAEWASWAGDGGPLLPLPQGEARGALLWAKLAAMDGPSFAHTALLWAKLAASQRGGDERAAGPITVLVPAEALFIMFCELCCKRLGAVPRSMTMWKLLARVLAELAPHEECARRMEAHVRDCILRYIETRDRPVAARSGLRQYREAFEVHPAGMNGDATGAFSPRDVVDVIRRLCGCDESTDVKGPEVEALEEFIRRFFFHGAPEAFDRYT